MEERSSKVICVFFLTSTSVRVVTKPTVAWKQVYGGEKRFLCVSGYLELFDSINCNYHSLNKKEETWGQISVALEILGKLFG